MKAARHSACSFFLSFLMTKKKRFATEWSHAGKACNNSKSLAAFVMMMAQKLSKDLECFFLLFPQ